MSQYFILDGILKRVVSNPEGKEMILRFACERDMETSYAAWRLGTPTPYGIVGVTKSRVASLPMKDWGAFLDARAATKQSFEYDVMKLMSDVMAHVITLHLLTHRAGSSAFCASTPTWWTAFRRRNWRPT